MVAEVITRKWEGSKLIEETKREIDWEPNAADMDILQVGCECGNKFGMPWDAVAFGGLGESTYCGQCGKSGTMKVIADPSPGKRG